MTPFATGNSIIDRQRSFVIDNSVDQALAAFCATKLLKASGPDAPPRQRVSAVAITERGTNKFSKVLRFAHNLPSSIAKSIDTWVSSPRPEARASLLFGAWANRISPRTWPLENKSSTKSAVAREVMKHCQILTIGQRCADWFVMRQFRVTGTLAGRFIMSVLCGSFLGSLFVLREPRDPSCSANAQNRGLVDCDRLRR